MSLSSLSTLAFVGLGLSYGNPVPNQDVPSAAQVIPSPTPGEEYGSVEMSEGGNSYSGSSLNGYSVQPLSPNAQAEVESPKYLDWRDRPRELQAVIDRSFDALQTNDGWVFAGEDQYLLAEVDDFKLVQQVVLDSYPAKKEFYILDIGAGRFQSSEYLKKQLDRSKKLPKDVKIHLIGVTAEPVHLLEKGKGRGRGRKSALTSRCTVYKWGSFKAENFSGALSGFSIQGENAETLIGKIDVIFANRIFRHLPDSVGSLTQWVSALQPEGFLLGDELVFRLTSYGKYHPSQVGHFTAQLFRDMHLPFFIRYNAAMNRQRLEFVVQRGEGEIQLPMTYVGIETGTNMRLTSTDSRTYTIFDRTQQAWDQGHFYFKGYPDGEHPGEYSGHYPLVASFITKKLFRTNPTSLTEVSPPGYEEGSE